MVLTVVFLVEMVGSDFVFGADERDLRCDGQRKTVAWLGEDFEKVDVDLQRQLCGVDACGEVFVKIAVLVDDGCEVGLVVGGREPKRVAGLRGELDRADGCRGFQCEYAAEAASAKYAECAAEVGPIGGDASECALSECCRARDSGEPTVLVVRALRVQWVGIKRTAQNRQEYEERDFVK